MALRVPPAPAEVPAPKETEPTEPNDDPSFFTPLHAPRLLFGQGFTLRQVVFVVIFLCCLTPWASPPIALALGLVLAQTIGNPFGKHTKQATAKLLQFSVIGLGFGMNAHAALQAGKAGIIFTVASIFGTLILGFFVGRGLGLNRCVVHLISCGTAICGGSAIAAIGPVLRARDEEMSVALGTVFVLNAIALFAFPPIGHALAMTQNQFGAVVRHCHSRYLVGSGRGGSLRQPSTGRGHHREAGPCPLGLSLWPSARP